jgi:opacity protein-like surface antigen
MKKLLIATVVAVSLGSVPWVASASSAAGMFLRVEGGQARYDISKTRNNDRFAHAYGISAGYRWNVSTPFALGVEAGYMTMGKLEDRLSGTTLDTSGVKRNVLLRNEVGTRAYLLGANARWAFARNWSLTGRLGFAHMRTRLWTGLEGDGIAAQQHKTLLKNSPYTGVGVNYAVSSNVDLGFNMTSYSARALAAGDRFNVNVYGISAEVRL